MSSLLLAFESAAGVSWEQGSRTNTAGGEFNG